MWPVNNFTLSCAGKDTDTPRPIGRTSLAMTGANSNHSLNSRKRLAGVMNKYTLVLTSTDKEDVKQCVNKKKSEERVRLILFISS